MIFITWISDGLDFTLGSNKTSVWSGVSFCHNHICRSGAIESLCCHDYFTDILKPPPPTHRYKQYHWLRDDGWQMILGHKRYRLMMYSCIAKLPCLLLKLMFLQWLQHDRVCGAANAVQGGVQPVVHEVPPPSQSASADQPEVRGARGEAQEDRAEQQPVQGTHTQTHTPHHHLWKTTMSGSADSRDLAHLRGTCQSTQSGDVTTKWMPRCLPERFRDYKLVCCLSKCAIKLAPLDRHTTETLFLRRIIKPALYLCHISRPSFNTSATSLPEQISFEQNSKLLALI